MTTWSLTTLGPTCRAAVFGNIPGLLSPDQVIDVFMLTC